MIANIEAESAVIAALVARPDAYWVLQPSRISVEHFTEPAYKAIFAAVRDVCDSGKVHSSGTIAAALPETLGEGDSTLAVLSSLRAQAAMERAPVVDFVEPLVRAFRSRRAEIVWAEAERMRVEKGAAQAIEYMAAKADEMRQDGRSRHATTLREAAELALKETAKNYEAAGRQTAVGLSTGIVEIDAMIGPMYPGNMITLAGRSGHGKSALLFQILAHIAAPSLDAGSSGPTFMQSMEMRDRELARRHLAAMTGVSTRKQRAGDIEHADFDSLTTAARSASERVIIDDDDRSLTARDIERNIRNAAARYGVVAAGIDHLRKVAPENPRWSDIETISDAIARFKRLAKDLNIVIFPLAQVTRDSAKRSDWRVNSGDIWGGNRVEEESDIMLAVSLPRKWLNQNKPEQGEQKAWDRWVAQYEEWSGKAEISALKTRDDEGGARRAVAFDGPRLAFG